LSLINIDISNRIREHNRKKLINFKYKADKIIAFDDKEFPKEVRTRINYWIEDIIDSVTLEYSSIQTEKIISCLENDVN
jgi:hypothetical protein